MIHRQQIVVPMLNKGTGRDVNGVYVPPAYTDTTFNVEVVIDEGEIARFIGGKAAQNKSGRAREIGGAVIVTATRATAASPDPRKAPAYTGLCNCGAGNSAREHTNHCLVWGRKNDQA